MGSQTCKIDVRRNVFSQKVENLCKSLFPSVMEGRSIYMFKLKIDKYLKVQRFEDYVELAQRLRPTLISHNGIECQGRLRRLGSLFLPLFSRVHVQIFVFLNKSFRFKPGSHK